MSLVRIFKHLKQFRRSENGSVQIIFAISIIPVIMSVGAAVDYSNVSRLRSQAQYSADAAILAAAVTVRDEGMMNGSLEEKTKKQPGIEKRLKSVFKDFYQANMPETTSFKLDNIKAKFDPKTGESSIELSNTYDPLIVGALTKGDIKVGVESAVVVEVKQVGAGTIYLVLDKSGSMDWNNPADNVKKMDALKAAVIAMSKNFELEDPDKELIRMGANAYDSYLQSSSPIKWGTKKTKKYVKNLTAYGGTNSKYAMKAAYTLLRGPDEENAHKKKHDNEIKKYIIFMTDGSNNYTSNDHDTKLICNDAKAEGIEIYSVAFAAPTRGQELLKNCASSTAHYLDAQNTTQLISAFQYIGTNVAQKATITK